MIDDYASQFLFLAENELQATSYRGRDLLDPEPGDRIYDDLPSIISQQPLDGPRIGIEKYSGNCTSELAHTEEAVAHTWCLVIENSGTSVARTPEVVDVLPFGWTYDSGSTAIVGQATAEPTGSVDPNGLEVLTWNLADLAAGDLVEITFTAQAAAGSPELVTNDATVVIFDEFGDPYDANVFGVSDADSAQASLKPFALEIAKTTDTQGVDENGPDDEAFPVLPNGTCLLYTSPSPRDRTRSRMPSSA